MRGILHNCLKLIQTLIVVMGEKTEFQCKQINSNYKIYTGQALTHKRQEQIIEGNKFISSAAQG